MRLLGLSLLFLGFCAVVAGGFVSCTSIFAWSGRRAVESHAFAPGSPEARTLVPEAGRRYSIGVQIHFDRGVVPVRDGVAEVEARLPLVVRVSDRSGTSLAETMGWLDPHEPPTALYGHGAQPQGRDRTLPDLFAERIVGPFGVSAGEPLDVRVDLGADRVGRGAIREARLVVYDDALPVSIKGAIGGAVAGVVVMLVGAYLTLVGFFRRRRRRRGARVGVPVA